MYVAIGKVAAMAGAVLAGPHKSAIEAGLRPVGPDPVPRDHGVVSLEALDAIGRDNEAVRNVCIDIAQKVASLSTLGADLTAFCNHMELILKDLEQSKSELIQRGAVLAMVQEAHDELKRAHVALQNDNERNKAELGMLRPEAQRLVDRVRSQEARIENAEARWTELQNAFAATETELAGEKSRNGYLTEEVASRRAELEKSDALVSQLQSEFANLSYRLSVSEETGRALQAALTESQQNAARLAAEAEISKAAYDMVGQRVVSLETEWASQQGEHLRVRAQLQQEIDQLRAAAGELQSRFDQLTSLKEVSERTLAAKLDELQVRTDELRNEERRTREAMAAALVIERKLQAEAAATAELTERLAEIDKNRNTLVAQIKPLLKTIEERNLDVEKLQQSLQAQSARIDQEAARHAAERDRMEGVVKDLTARLEDEKARRALAEGALDEDRRARVELQLAVSSVKTPAPAEPRRPPPAAKRKPPLLAGE